MATVPLGRTRTQEQATPALASPRAPGPQDLAGGAPKALGAASQLLLRARDEARRLNYTEAKSQRGEQLQGLMDEYHQLGQKAAMEKYGEYMDRLDDIWSDSAAFFENDSKTAEAYNAERGTWIAGGKARVNAHFNGEKKKYLQTNSATSQKNAFMTLRQMYYDTDLARLAIQDHENTIAVVDGELGLSADDTIANILRWRRKAYNHMLGSAWADDQYGVMAELLSDTGITKTISPEELVKWSGRSETGNLREQARSVAFTKFDKASEAERFDPAMVADLNSEIRDEFRTNPALADLAVRDFGAMMSDQRIKKEHQTNEALISFTETMRNENNAASGLKQMQKFIEENPSRAREARMAYSNRYGAYLKAKNKEQREAIKTRIDRREQRMAYLMRVRIDNDQFAPGVNEGEFMSEIAGFTEKRRQELISYLQQGGVEGTPKLNDRVRKAVSDVLGKKRINDIDFMDSVFQYVSQNLQPGKPVTEAQLYKMVRFLKSDVIVGGENKNVFVVDKDMMQYTRGFTVYKEEMQFFEDIMTGEQALERGLIGQARPRILEESDVGKITLNGPTIEGTEELAQIRKLMEDNNWPTTNDDERRSGNPLLAEQEFKRQVILGLAPSTASLENFRTGRELLALKELFNAKIDQQKSDAALRQLADSVKDYTFGDQIGRQAMDADLLASAEDFELPAFAKEAFEKDGSLVAWNKMFADWQESVKPTREQIVDYLVATGNSLLRQVDQ